ncbi:MAG: phosphatidylglycerophosphatase A, partial [Deltaproteobacteria bacterium]|nr:phosphatidylglycerophosphatase A [Deltaproteobacteria bacterium]
VSFWVAGEAEKIYGAKDCQKIVIDEVAGQMLTFTFAAFTWQTALIGFILFRFFDMVKIFPANWAQKKLPGGFGVVGDDLVAGLQAAAVLYGLQWIPAFAGMTNP